MRHSCRSSEDKRAKSNADGKDQDERVSGEYKDPISSCHETDTMAENFSTFCLQFVLRLHRRLRSSVLNWYLAGKV